MILIEAGGAASADFEAKVLFAQVLSAAGHRPVVDERTLPPDAELFVRYEAAPLLVPIDQVEPTALIVIGAESLDTGRAGALRFLPSSIVSVAAVGRFATRQALMAVQARLSHATTKEPRMVDLNVLGPALPTLSGAFPPFGCADPVPRQARPVPRVLLCLSPELLADPMTLPAVTALGYRHDLSLAVLLPPSGGSMLPAYFSAGLRVFRSAELSPAALARAADIVVLTEWDLPQQRLPALAFSALWADLPVVDMTPAAALASTGAPVLRGPGHVAALGDYLAGTVFPARGTIADRIRQSPWRQAAAFARLEKALGLQRPSDAPPPAPQKRPQATFMVTNGVGLGHAKRASLIARSMRHADRSSFAAFPSCVDMIGGQGFPVCPLVARSTDHEERSANDLMNYLRLRRTIEPGGVFVFDGGYVFDGVLRLIGEMSLRATWIRRGLWQSAQITPHVLEREKAFRQVIVPGEAFAELNRPLSYGPHVRDVGPIVGEIAQDAKARLDLRDRLVRALGVPFGTLVVSMLGAGVAADRSALLQVLCQLAERRPGTLHLIVTWPGAVVPPHLMSYRNSRVVRTLRATQLAAAADLVVSAAGYNAFHECLYNQIPAIFVAQMAEYMDDQALRAKAAAERGVAVAVDAHELLLLDREARAILDDGKAATMREQFRSLDLPQRGTAAAAALIDGELDP